MHIISFLLELVALFLDLQNDCYSSCTDACKVDCSFVLN